MKNLLLPALFCLIHVTLTAQWVTTHGPYGGYVYQLKANNDYVFASKSSGLYRSADVGLHWEICDATNLFGRIAVDGKNILASYGDNDEPVLRYSSDNGDHWDKVALPIGTPFLDNFAVKGNIVLFTHLGKLWRSANLGLNWSVFELPGEPFQEPRLLGTFEGHIYLGNFTRLLTSDDGFNWTFLATVPGISGNPIWRLYRKGNVMVSSVAQTVGRSLDAGHEWETATITPGGGLGANVEFSSENGVLYASTGGPMLKSTNNGLSWDYINSNGPKLLYHTSKNNILLGHLLGLGLFRSTDGGQTFETANHGLGGGDVLTMGLQNNDLWLWDERGIVRQNTNQFDWEAPLTYPLPTYLGSFVTIFHFKNAVFIRKDHGELLRSLDGWQSWTTVTPDASIVSSDFIEFNTQNDSLFLSGEFYKTYLSTDFGDHWQLINPQVDSQISSNMKDMAVQGTQVFVTDNQQVYRSDQHLQSWELVGDSMPFGTAATRIRLFATPHFLFAYVNQERVFRSANLGESWTEVSIPFPPVFYNWLENEVVFAEIKDAVVAFFERGGVFVSHDGGLSWDIHNEGLPYPEATSSFVYNENNMWVGTSDFGLYQRSTNDLAPLAIAEPFGPKSPLNIFPNPTQGNFSCKLPPEISGEVTLTVFDLQGKQMLRRAESAEHLQNIDLSRFTKGVYWVRIATQHGIFDGKVLVQ